MKHYDQAVGQFEQFVKIFADQQRIGAANASRHDLRVNLRDRGEIDPKQGLAAISTSTSPPSSRANTARCTLPPGSAEIGVSGVRASRLAEVCPHALIITRSDGGSDEFHSFNSVSKRRQVRAGRVSGAD